MVWQEVGRQDKEYLFFFKYNWRIFSNGGVDYFRLFFLLRILENWIKLERKIYLFEGIINVMRNYKNYGVEVQERMDVQGGKVGNRRYFFF